MKKIVRLTESDLARIVKKVIRESNRGYLMEDRRLLNEEPQVAKMTVKIPTTKDKTGKLQVSYGGTILYFTIFNQKGTNSTSLKIDSVKKITQVTLPDGTKLTPFKQSKDSEGNLICQVSVNDKLAPILKKLIGTNIPITDYTKMSFTYTDNLGGNTSAYVGPVNFITYDVDQPTQPK